MGAGTEPYTVWKVALSNVHSGLDGAGRCAVQLEFSWLCLACLSWDSSQVLVLGVRCWRHELGRQR